MDSRNKQQLKCRIVYQECLEKSVKQLFDNQKKIQEASFRRQQVSFTSDQKLCKEWHVCLEVCGSERSTFEW